MNAVVLIATACMTLTFGCVSQNNDITGKWIGQFFVDYMPSSDDSGTFTLEFKPDGTFTGRHQIRVMMIRDTKLTGKYTREGEKLTLAGTAETFLDDGYREGTSQEAFEMQLRIESSRLTRLPYDAKAALMFRRDGAPKLAPPPKPPAKPSQSAAEVLLRRVEQKYAVLKTYSDDGVFTSSGKGFQPKQCRFKTRYSSDGRFLFRSDLIANGKVFETNAAWATSSKAWVHSSTIEGSEERPIGNALSIIGMDFSTLIPSLLMTKRMGYSDLSKHESVVLRQDEVLGKNKCKVVDLDSGTEHAIQIWIDAETLLIRKAHGSFLDTTARFEPKVNVTIADSEFIFRK